MSASPIVVLNDVVKTFGSLTVLRNLGFEIARGEHVCLIGPSGSGKSTILRIIMGLEDIQGGALTIDGDPIWTAVSGAPSRPADRRILAAARRKIGMVFQSFNLFPHMTALENIAEAPIRVRGLPKDEAYELARTLLKSVGLASKEGNRPANLSGGQQQRIAIARAMAMQPKVMLFDEVTSALDPETIGDVLNVIKDFAAQFDLTVLMATHQMGFARRFSHRIVFMENGRIVEQGDPDRFFDNPAEIRTREFLRAVMDV